MEIKKRDDNGGCTIVIPTYNRSYYLKRLLSYYNEYLDNEYGIIVADSSYHEHKKRNQEIVSCFPRLGVLYLDEYSSAINQNRKIFDALGYVKTKYCVICADDDFITPQGIKQSKDFLEKNSDFTVAQGLVISFSSRSTKNKRQFYCDYGSQQSSITFSEPKLRLIYHLLNYSATFYGVHRSDFLRMIFKESESFTNDLIFEELLLSMLTLIYGKKKYLDVFYGARDKSGNIKSNMQTFWLNDFIKEGSYNEKCVKFKEGLVMHLVKNYQPNMLDIEEARKAIDATMSIYLSIYVKEIKSVRKKLLICKIKNILEHLSLPSWIYGAIRALYRKLFLARETTHQKRMDDFKGFAETPFSKYYEEIQRIYNHLLSFSIPIPDKKNDPI